MNSKLAHLLQFALHEIQAGNLALAKNYLIQALELDQKNPDSLRFLGVVAALENKWLEALNFIDLSIEVDPKNGITRSNRGNIFMELKRFEEALGCYEEAIRLEPAYAEAYNNKGNALQAIERFEEALGCYEESIRFNPSNSLAFCGAARIFNVRQQFELAIVCSNRAIEINSQNIDAWLNKGFTYLLIKDFVNALAAYDAALGLDPECVKALMSKGHIYFESKDFKLAQICFEKVYSLDPSIDFVYGLYTQATLHMCEWKDQDRMIGKLIEAIRCGKKVALPYNLITLLDDGSLIKKANEIYGETIQLDINRVPKENSQSGKKIRVGYFSADFHNHPTAYLIAELFEKHDKSQFELVGFVFGRNYPDEMRERLVNAFDQFIDVDEKTDKEIAALSREMGIDIAVDLKGYTQGGRPKIFMYGAAPIQVSYLGFPGTMGLRCFDYIIADHVLIPKEMQEAYVEKVIYMPDSYQVNDRCRKISEKNISRKDFGLPESGFIFCCFNNNYKITPAVFDGWIRILKAVPGSVIWLFEDNELAVENLKKEAISRGLEEGRIIFADRANHAEHLARYKLADLFLDTFPCNAHTTASDALWAGLPVLTLIGKSFAARVAASLLSAIGLTELIAEDQDGYEEIAISLASDSTKLRSLKETLWRNRLIAPLFDTSFFVHNLELAYKSIYERHQLGLPPNHIEVN